MWKSLELWKTWQESAVTRLLGRNPRLLQRASYFVTVEASMSPVMISALFLLQLLFPFATPTAPQSQQIYGPAFSLDVSPTRPVMVQGGSTVFNVFIRSDKPAAFRVRIEGIPASVTADIPQVGPGVSTIVLHSLPGTPTGTYAIQVTAASGSNQQTQTFALDIKPLRPKQ